MNQQTGSAFYQGSGTGTNLNWNEQPATKGSYFLYGVSCPPAGGSCFAAGDTANGGGGEVAVDTAPLLGPPPVPASYLAGGSPCPCTDGSGVVTPTGDFYMTTTNASAATFGPSLDFGRTYDALVAQTASTAGTPGPLGYGWSSDDFQSLKPNTPATGDVTAVGPTGGQTEFDPPSSGACPQPYQSDPSATFAAGSYCAASYVTSKLTYDSTAQQYTLVTHPYEKDVFSSSGELLSTTDAQGNSETFSYPPGGTGSCPGAAVSCVVVQSASGRTVVAELTETQPTGSPLYPLDQVTTVVDPIGRSWSYSYCTTNSSTCLQGDLVGVTGPLGRTTSYTYDSGNSTAALRHDLKTVTVPNAQPGGPDAGDSSSVSYDSSGRATMLSDPMGHQTSYNYAGIAAGTGDVVVTDGDGFETDDTFAGNVETSTTADAGGSAPATTTLSPNFSTLETVQSVDPDQQPRQFSFDGNGNQTTATSPQSETTSSYLSATDEPLCTSTPVATTTSSSAFPGDVCASLAAAASLAPVNQPVGGALTSTPSASSGAPPPGVTLYSYDTAGNLVYTTTGIWSGSTFSSFVGARTTYDLYGSDTLTLTVGGVQQATISCTVQSEPASLPCATVAAPDTSAAVNPTVTQLGYDSSGDLTSSRVIDANGSADAVTTHTYDSDGELTSTTSPLGNAAGADAALYTTISTLDGAGEPTATTTGLPGTVLGSSSATVYDQDGNATSQQDARWQTTTTAFNADDQASMVTDPDGHSTLRCFDGLGQVVTSVPPDGVGSLTPSSCRSASPWGLASPPSDATSTAYSFGSSGEVVTTNAPAPAGQTGTETTTQYYDPAGHLTVTIAPPIGVSSGHDTASVATYDADGRQVGLTSGLSWSTSTQTFATTGATTTTSSCYDALGELAGTVPGDANTGATVSSAGAVSGFVCAPGSSTTSSSYETKYTYDSAGDVLTTTRPISSTASSTTTGTYYPDGSLATVQTATAVTNDLFYLPDGQLETVTHVNEPVLSVSYDVAGERTAMTDAASVTGSQSTYAYTPSGQLASVTNESGQTISYGYDPTGNLDAVSYPLPSASWATNDTVEYGRDQAGLLTSMTDFAGSTVAIANDANGMPTALTLPTTTAVSVKALHDNTAAPCVVALVPTATALTTCSGGSRSGTLLGFTYSDKPPGEVATETDTPAPTCSRTYAYNAAAEVSSFQSSSCQVSYAYDASGNPTTLPGGANAVYKIGSELCWSGTGSGGCGSPPTGAVTYSYNADEAMTGESGGATVSTSWGTSWGGRDLLDSYSDSAANMTAAVYDGDGLRARDTFSGTTQDFAWDEVSSSVPRLLVDGTNAYLYAERGTPLEQVALSSGTASYLVADKLGSVRGVVSTSGSLSGSTAYDPWGNPSSSGGLTSYTPFGFAGGYTDPTGLVYLLARYYNPQTGQFLSVDPLVDRTGQPFAYTGNDPVNRVDPSGDVQYRTDTGENCTHGYQAVCAGSDLTDQQCHELFNATAGSETSCTPPPPAPIGEVVSGLARLWGYTALGVAGLPDVPEAAATAATINGLIDGSAAVRGIGAGVEGGSGGVDATTQALQEHLSAAIDRFNAEGFTERQAAALEDNPGLAGAFRGTRIDSFFKESLNNAIESGMDPRVANLYVTRAGELGPDVFDLGPGPQALDRWWDVTTPGQWAQHAGDYAIWGTGVPLFTR